MEFLKSGATGSARQSVQALKTLQHRTRNVWPMSQVLMNTDDVPFFSMFYATVQGL